MEEVRKEWVMFYNVENLFPPDERFAKGESKKFSGLKRWNEWRYKNKLYRIHHLFELIKAEKKELPMLIGLAEIAANSVLEDLLKMPVFEGKYDFIHYDSLDERGVDTALLYDKTKIKHIDSETISFIFEFDADIKDGVDTTRDVLQCKLEFQGEIINVFVLHLPSKREQDINQPKRDYILNTVKDRVLDLAKSREATIILGDFNENPYAENINFLLYKEGSDKLLENPFIHLYNQKKYSTFYQKQGLLFDQILLSEDFYMQSFPLRFQNAEIFTHQDIKNQDKRHQGKPFRTYVGTRYLGGYSDHFPVLVEFLNQI
ncbi:MAG: endonuclease [Flavobacteriaceae bacterium]|nr:endonuclease [Flavobacteriaceae bacterium]